MISVFLFKNHKRTNHIMKYTNEFIFTQKCIPWRIIKFWNCGGIKQWRESEIFEEWSIGIYKMTFHEEKLEFTNYKTANNPVLTAKNLGDKRVQYVADPFLVAKNGIYYMFFEVLKNNKGIIGLAASKDCRKWKFKKIILEEPFHLSYPFIFNWEGKYYMLPESQQTKSVRLYEANNFPDGWRFVKTLLEGKNFVDPTIFYSKNKFWLFVSDTSDSNLYLYYSDSLKDGWEEHPKNPIIKDNLSMARPGGNVIEIENKLIRIAQDDLKDYGYAVRAFEITKLNTQEYEEKELAESPLLKASGRGWNKDGMHQLSVCRTAEKEWIVSVDGKTMKKRYKYRIMKYLEKFIFEQKCVPWFMILKWRSLHQRGRLYLKKVKTRLTSLIFEQKCIPWFVIERWRKFYWRMDWEIKQGHPWLKEFIFKRKGMPWFVIHRWRKLYWRMDWEIKQGHPWLKKFIFEQKCVPWSVTERWRKFYWRMDWEIKQTRARLLECFRKAKQIVSKAKDSDVLQIRKPIQQWERRGLILMYHRVKDLDCDPWQLCVTPSRFEEHMQVLKKYGRPVQMREMGKNLKHFSSGDKEIVLTFDDGYADNFYNAKPILEHYEIPATFFIVSGSVGSQEEYWWDELERIILASGALPSTFELTIGGIKYHFPIIQERHNESCSYSRMENDIPSNDTELSRDRLYFTLWRILSLLSSEEKKVVLRQITEWSGQSSSPRQTHRTMTSQELVSLAKCPLFEIGAHTVYHPLLSKLTAQEQENEIGRSKRDLEGIIGCGITSFSYPHGCYTDDTVKIVEHQKFQAACTTEQQPVIKNISPYLLPRFEVLNWDGDQFEQELQKWLSDETKQLMHENNKSGSYPLKEEAGKMLNEPIIDKGQSIPESFSEAITGNDKWVLHISKGKKGGFFIEAGACDGTFGSNTYALELHNGWEGICVEPSDAFFEKLKMNRKCICVNCCLGDKKGVVQYIECQNCYSGIKDYLDVEKEEFWKDGTTKQKPLALLQDVLRENNAPKVVDYLSLDTEGSEYAILKGFPFDEYKILALTIEGDVCNDLLLSKGYVRVENPYNTGAPWEQYFLHPDMISG